MIDKINALLMRKSSCVLATTDGNIPHCSLMSYITSEAADRFFLVTSIHTKKYRNIKISEAWPGYPIVYANPAFTLMTGYEPEEVIGKSPSILQGPKTDQEVIDRLKMDITHGRVFNGRAINYRKDGSEFMM